MQFGMGFVSIAAYFLSASAIAQGADSAASTPIKVNPSTAEIRLGDKKTFTAGASGIATPNLVWSVVSTAATFKGALGTMTSAGVYTSPADLPTPNTVLIKVSDSSHSMIFGTAAVTLLNPLPAIASLSSTSINTGLAYVIDLKGTGFLAASQVVWDGKPVPTKFISSTDLQIGGTSALPAGTNVTLSVSNPDPGTKISNTRTLSVLPPVAVQVSPDKRSIRCGTTLDFNAHVTNNADQTVDWQVNGKPLGDSILGAINAQGLYTAPALAPNAAITITAVSKADPKASASVGLTLLNPVPAIVTSPTSLKIGPVTFTVKGTGFAKTAAVLLGGTALNTIWVSDKQLTAMGNFAAPLGGAAALKVVNPDPGAIASVPMVVTLDLGTTKMAYADAVRFLEMATWGPTPASVAHLQQVGRDAWLADQFSMSASAWPDPIDSSEGLSRLQQSFFTNAMTGNDQLRQRVAFALGQIFVVSGVKDTRFAQMVPYVRMLNSSAFGNFRSLMDSATLSPTMGLFLDMVNNDKANATKNTVANENYARELMQLFTLGINVLNQDGTPVMGSSPAYDEATVKDLAKVFTGWTYAPAPGFASQWKNPEYYFAPMIPFAEHHDSTVKTLNFTTPCPITGVSAQSDLDMALGCIYNHSNVGPFIAYRLIQRLVKSNPSPEYVSRVAAAFNGPNRGDLKAVITAVLIDPEASTEGSGKLAEPVLFATTLLRALDVTVTGEASGIAGQTEAMGQKVLFPGSVFNYFSPFYHIPFILPPTIAPEFQILNAATSLARANYVYRTVNNGISGNIRVNFSNWEDLATDPAKLVDLINQALYRGEMTSDQKTIVITAAKAATDMHTRVRNAVYVAAAAPQYQVER